MTNIAFHMSDTRYYLLVFNKLCINQVDQPDKRLTNIDYHNICYNEIASLKLYTVSLIVLEIAISFPFTLIKSALTMFIVNLAVRSNSHNLL